VFVRSAVSGRSPKARVSRLLGTASSSTAAQPVAGAAVAAASADLTVKQFRLSPRIAFELLGDSFVFLELDGGEYYSLQDLDAVVAQLFDGGDHSLRMTGSDVVVKFSDRDGTGGDRNPLEVEAALGRLVEAGVLVEAT